MVEGHKSHIVFVCVHSPNQTEQTKRNKLNVPQNTEVHKQPSCVLARTVSVGKLEGYCDDVVTLDPDRYLSEIHTKQIEW